MKKGLNEWYSNQVSMQLDEGKALHDIEVQLKLSTLKPLHAQWLVDLFNQMTTNDGRRIISSAWKASGITDAIEKGASGMESRDPFNDLDPMIDLHIYDDSVKRVPY